MKFFEVDSQKLPKPHSAIAQAALDLDETWFRANPKAKTRVREYRPGEFGPGVHLAPKTRIQVIRLEAFVFIRIPVNRRAGGAR